MIPLLLFLHHPLWLRYSSVFHWVCDLLLSLHTISRQSVASIQRNEVLLLVAATLVAATTQMQMDRSAIGQNHVVSVDLLKNILCFGSKWNCENVTRSPKWSCFSFRKFSTKFEINFRYMYILFKSTTLCSVL